MNKKKMLLQHGLLNLYLLIVIFFMLVFCGEGINERHHVMPLWYGCITLYASQLLFAVVIIKRDWANRILSFMTATVSLGLMCFLIAIRLLVANHTLFPIYWL